MVCSQSSLAAHGSNAMHGKAAGSSGADDERPGENACACGSEYRNAENEKQAGDKVQGIVRHDGKLRHSQQHCCMGEASHGY